MIFIIVKTNNLVFLQNVAFQKHRENFYFIIFFQTMNKKCMF